jgi:hypothetical protein
MFPGPDVETTPGPLPPRPGGSVQRRGFCNILTRMGCDETSQKLSKRGRTKVLCQGDSGLGSSSVWAQVRGSPSPRLRLPQEATRDCVAGQAALKALPNHVVIEMEDHRCKSLLMTWQLRLQMGHRHRCRNRQDVCGRRYESLTRNGFAACHMAVVCF